MRLADFIESNMEPIVVQWEEFAATRLPAAASMNSLELRDHAHKILEAIAADLRSSQTPEAQRAKSLGLAPEPFPARETAAQTHAVLRARSGFDIKQLAAEYRALRASVLCLWLDSHEPGERLRNDVVRFDEAIDQALAESIAHFHAQVEQSRNLVLGMLGHDMRSPLQTIKMTATYLRHLNAGDSVSQAARRLIDSGARLQGLLDDLVDFNRLNLGLGINIARQKISLAEVCVGELEQVRSAHPECPIELTVTGNSEGHWDPKRIQQMLCNLVENAITHGTSGGPVRVALTANETHVRLEVANSGNAIEPDTLSNMFEPLTRGMCPGPDTGLGLGLYIVKELASAHGGSAEVRSEEGATVFTVRLPKQEAAEAAKTIHTAHAPFPADRRDV
jgi:signal transduction histidine kinase